MIKDLHRACGKLPLRSSKHHNLWRRPRHLIIASASSTFRLSTPKSFRCQSGLQEGCHSIYLSALSRWASGHMEGFDNRAPTRYLLSFPTVSLTSTSWPLCHHPAAQEALFSCLQCSQCRDLRQLFCFKWFPRTDASMVGLLSRRWKLVVGGEDIHARNPQPRDPCQRGLQSMQDLYILGLEGLLFLSTPLRVTRQGISSSISFALSIINPEVVPWQFLGPTDLFRAQVFCIHKVLEVVIVCKNENFMLSVF